MFNYSCLLYNTYFIMKTMNCKKKENVRASLLSPMNMTISSSLRIRTNILYCNKLSMKKALVDSYFLTFEHSIDIFLLVLLYG